MATSIATLPATVVGASKPPAVLGLMQFMSTEEALIPMLEADDAVLPALLACLSVGANANANAGDDGVAGTGSGRGAGASVVEVVLTIIDNLLRTEVGAAALRPHASGLIHHFTLRFQSGLAAAVAKPQSFGRGSASGGLPQKQGNGTVGTLAPPILPPFRHHFATTTTIC